MTRPRNARTPALLAIAALALPLAACAGPARPAAGAPTPRRPLTGCWRAAVDVLTAQRAQVRETSARVERASAELARSSPPSLDPTTRAALASAAFDAVFAVPDELVPYDPAALGLIARGAALLEERSPDAASQPNADRDALVVLRAALRRTERVYADALRQTEGGVMWTFECLRIAHAEARRAADQQAERAAASAQGPVRDVVAARVEAERCLAGVREQLARSQQGAALAAASACEGELGRTAHAYREAQARLGESGELHQRLQRIHASDRELSRREGALLHARVTSVLARGELAAVDPETSAALQAHAEQLTAATSARAARFAALQEIRADLTVLSERLGVLQQLILELECEPMPARCQNEPNAGSAASREHSTDASVRGLLP